MKRFLLYIATFAVSISIFAALPTTVLAVDDPADSPAYKCETFSDDPCTALNSDSSNPCVTDVTKCGTLYYVNGFVNLLAAFVGVAVVISIIIGGIQYSSSAGDPQKATAAKARIRNAIIAMVAFLFIYALLNFVVLGGV